MQNDFCNTICHYDIVSARPYSIILSDRAITVGGTVMPILLATDMEACVGAHHLSRRLKALGHDARLMPAKYVRPYSKGQKNDFRDAEAIAEAVQRPTMPMVSARW